MDNETLDRISYALGLSMGNNFRASGIKTIDVRVFATAWPPCLKAPHLK